MGKIIGVGATKNSGNKEIAVLKAQIKTLNNEVEILKVEKEDLEKLPTELSNKVAELEKQIETEQTIQVENNVQTTNINIQNTKIFRRKCN